MTGERYPLVCGVDEAGRGPLAGPVFAACVILDASRPIRGLADSKQLPPERREELALRIRERALACAVASASVEEIDRMNILQATLTAMRRAVESLGVAPTQVVIDGNRCPTLQFPTRAVVGGDATVRVISAASILAKTARDALMLELHAACPEYGFDRHKGYATPQHLEALRLHGASQFHRRSFAPVRAVMLQMPLF
jgi:ribonuclease HII